MHIGHFESVARDNDLFDPWVRSMVALSEHAGYTMSFVFGTNADMVKWRMSEYDNELDSLLVLRMAEARSYWKRLDLSDTDYARSYESLRAEFARAHSYDPNCTMAVMPDL